jgi:hypothetical protein
MGQPHGSDGTDDNGGVDPIGGVVDDPDFLNDGDGDGGTDDAADSDTGTTASVTPTVEELTAQLAAAKATATRAAAAAARERKARQAGGVNKNGKRTTAGSAGSTGAEADDGTDRSTWPEAARKAVEKLERDAAQAQDALAAANTRAVTDAIRAGLLAAGLKMPAEASEEDKRKLFKRVTRMMDIESIHRDEDGDVIGVEDEISLVKDLLPDLFGDPPQTAIAAERLAMSPAIPAPPKPRVNAGGGNGSGRGAPAANTPRPWRNSAEKLMSKEYKKAAATGDWKLLDRGRG